MRSILIHFLLENVSCKLASDLETSLRKKLDQSFSEPWGAHSILRPSLENFAVADGDGSLTGSLTLHKTTRTGEEALVAEYPFGPLATQVDVDDFLADVLSRLLADHNSWPR